MHTDIQITIKHLKNHKAKLMRLEDQIRSYRSIGRDVTDLETKAKYQADVVVLYVKLLKTVYKVEV